MRARPAIAIAIAAAATLLAGLPAGCGGDDRPAPAPRAAGSPALTKEQAAQVLGGHQAAGNKAAETFDRKALAATETDPQLEMDVAAYKLRRAARQRPAAVRYTAPAFYIPRLTGHPRWFVADVAAARARRALLFVQARPAAPWRLAAAPYSTGTPLRGIALDDQGYAAPLDPGDKTLGPAKVPAAHAALLSRGPGAAGAARIAAGPQTTQSYDALSTAQDRLKAGGIALTSRFVPHDAPVYALRTRDGGALVWYVLRQNESYKASRKGRLAVTGDVVGLAPSGAARTRLGTTVLIQYLAKLQRDAPAAVTGMYRKAVRATAS